jgi:hypothetical protein
MDGAAQKIGMWRGTVFAGVTGRDVSVEIRSGVSGLSDGLLPAARVIDGLGSIGCAMPGMDARRTAQRMASAMRVIDVGLLRARSTRSLDIEGLRRAGVKELKSISTFRTHSVPFAALAERARALCTPLIPEAAWVRSLDGIEPRAATREATSRILRMPQIRSAEDPAVLSLTEYENCLREAQATRGIPADDAELLAVFRRIPVEGVTRIRFVESSRLLFFVLAADRKIRRTRVHDVMAIRNVSTGQVHLVTHRTRYQTAVLC